MKRQRDPRPGGYRTNSLRKPEIYEGICSCCGTKPIAKGNRKLCVWCYTDSWDEEFRPDPNLIEKKDLVYLTIKVMEMERTPPTPVKHFSCDNHTQEELQAILKGEMG